MFVLSLWSYPSAHLCHILVIPSELLSGEQSYLISLTVSPIKKKKKKSEALNMSSWHLSDCQGCHQVLCVRG